MLAALFEYCPPSHGVQLTGVDEEAFPRGSPSENCPASQSTHPSRLQTRNRGQCCPGRHAAVPRTSASKSATAAHQVLRQLGIMDMDLLIGVYKMYSRPTERSMQEPAGGLSAYMSNIRPCTSQPSSTSAFLALQLAQLR